MKWPPANERRNFAAKRHKTERKERAALNSDRLSLFASAFVLFCGKTALGF